MPKISNVLSKVSELCKLRGFFVEKSVKFIDKSVENRNGKVYDYGPLGVELKRNVSNEWWHEIVTSQDNIYGLDLSMLTNVQQMSHNADDELYFHSSNSLVEYFAETCHHAVDYMDNYGFKIPFGLAQNIKILPPYNGSGDVIDQFIFRSQQKEFLKLCFFCQPSKLNFWMDYWMRKRLSWWKNYADIPSGFLLTETPSQALFSLENSSSLTDSMSVEYKFPWGKEAIESLSSYLSIQDLTNTVKEIGVLVATLSVERGILAYLLDAFQEKEVVNGEDNTTQYNILRLHPVLAPVKVSVFSNNISNGDISKVAQQLATELRQAGIPSSYVESGESTNCYLKQDEVGTPYCVTIQDSTLINGIVTLRNRDTTLSEFLHISEIMKTVQRHLNSF